MSKELEFDINISHDENQYYLFNDGTILEIGYCTDADLQNNEDIDNPRNWEHDSKFITFNRSSVSPDENEFGHWDEMLKHFGVAIDDDQPRYMKSELAQLDAKALEQGIAILPVWKYDHSDIVLRAAENNPFPDAMYDSGLVGVIYENLNGRDANAVKDQLRNEVEMYDRYLHGDIYRYAIYDREGNEQDCGSGYYDMEDLIFNSAGSDKPVKDLGCHSDIANCLYENRKELAQTRGNER